MEKDGTAELAIEYLTKKVGASSPSTCVRSLNRLVAFKCLIPVARRRGR